MIEARVFRGEELLFTRMYDGPALTLEGVMQQLERYVVEEMLNAEGECTLRVRFHDLQRKKAA